MRAVRVSNWVKNGPNQIDYSLATEPCTARLCRKLTCWLVHYWLSWLKPRMTGMTGGLKIGNAAQIVTFSSLIMTLW